MAHLDLIAAGIACTAAAGTGCILGAFAWAWWEMKKGPAEQDA